MSGCALILGAGTSELRAAVGPSAWRALEELCLRAEPTEHGWVAAGGVRDLGARMGVTKDTAARAVAVLLRAGLVLRHRLGTETGQRAAYLIRESTDLLLCLDDRDSVLCPEDDDTNREHRLLDEGPHSPDVERAEAPVCSKREDTDECRHPSQGGERRAHDCPVEPDRLDDPDARTSTACHVPSGGPRGGPSAELKPDRPRSSRRSRSAPENVAQGRLFELTLTCEVES